MGLIEGIAEATASLSKFIFGLLSDYFQKRKPFVVMGYTLGTLSKLLIGLALGWPLVLLARFIDRLGKGLRTAARDSLLLENTTSGNKGFIFGFHRSQNAWPDRNWCFVGQGGDVGKNAAVFNRRRDYSHRQF